MPSKAFWRGLRAIVRQAPLILDVTDRLVAAVQKEMYPLDHALLGRRRMKRNIHPPLTDAGISDKLEPCTSEGNQDLDPDAGTKPPPPRPQDEDGGLPGAPGPDADS